MLIDDGIKSLIPICRDRHANPLPTERHALHEELVSLPLRLYPLFAGGAPLPSNARLLAPRGTGRRSARRCLARGCARRHLARFGRLWRRWLRGFFGRRHACSCSKSGRINCRSLQSLLAVCSIYCADSLRFHRAHRCEIIRQQMRPDDCARACGLARSAPCGTPTFGRKQLDGAGTSRHAPTRSAREASSMSDPR